MKYIYMYIDLYYMYIMYLFFRINDVNRCIYVLDVVSYVFVLWEWGIFVVVGFVEVYQGS